MWLFFDGGFVSIVEFRVPGAWTPKRGDGPPVGDLLVRARARADLEKFCKIAMAHKVPIEETLANDYRFRARLARVAVLRAMTFLVEELDYPNFKSRVYETQGAERAGIYGDVWHECQHIDDRYR